MPKIPGDFTSINDQDIKDALEELSGEYAWPSPCQIIIPKFKVGISDLLFFKCPSCEIIWYSMSDFWY